MEIEIESEGKMDLWYSWCKTDPKNTKQIKKGPRTITVIDAYAQIKIVTKQLGMMGKYGFKNIKLDIHEPFAFLVATFFYSEGEFDICNSVDMYIRPRDKPPRVDPDWGKKLMTDSLTKAFSYIGVSNDVFEGKFDDNRYIEERTKETTEETLEANKVVYNRCKDLLLMKKEIMGEEGYVKMLKSLDDAVMDINRLNRAEKLINGITKPEA